MDVFNTIISTRKGRFFLWGEGRVSGKYVLESVISPGKDAGKFDGLVYTMSIADGNMAVGKGVATIGKERLDGYVLSSLLPSLPA